MSRVLTCCLRIGWATNHSNVSLSIAAEIFLNAGILIIYIINIIFAQRILRAKQPKLGWHWAVRAVFTTVYSLIGIALVMVITLLVMTFYTLDEATLVDATWILRGCLLYLLLVCLSPLLILALAYGLPRPEYTEEFGYGSINSKAVLVVMGSCLCATSSGFKTGVFWSPARPIADPAWYDSKAAFYCFIFSIEIMILGIYTVSRIDKRFWIPNGSGKRRTYVLPISKESVIDEHDDEEKRRDSALA